MKHVGIDFDNTIVCYDDVFYQAAVEQNLLPPGLNLNKSEVRNHFRSIGQEEEWTRLQGRVYGSRMELAKPFDGISGFFQKCQASGIKISIVSHKTKTPYLGPKYDLHAEAKKWLFASSFFHQGIDAYFELTLEKKMQRIQDVSCEVFIDDLPELLSEPGFPKGVRKILFDPSNAYPPNPEWTKLTSWNEAFSILKMFQRS